MIRTTAPADCDFCWDIDSLAPLKIVVLAGGYSCFSGLSARRLRAVDGDRRRGRRERQPKEPMPMSESA
jgi:hypothetical protein